MVKFNVYMKKSGIDLVHFYLDMQLFYNVSSQIQAIIFDSDTKFAHGIVLH